MLVRARSAKQIEVLPVFYATISASQNLELAGSLRRVEKINRWLREVAAEQQVPIAATALEPLFEQKELKESLTADGVHLNATGRAIYLRVLLQLLAEDS